MTGALTWCRQIGALLRTTEKQKRHLGACFSDSEANRGKNACQIGPRQGGIICSFSRFALSRPRVTENVSLTRIYSYRQIKGTLARVATGPELNEPRNQWIDARLKSDAPINRVLAMLSLPFWAILPTTPFIPCECQVQIPPFPVVLTLTLDAHHSHLKYCCYE